MKIWMIQFAIIAIISCNANALVIGNPNDFNCHPFGCDEFWQPEYQQIYDASYFSGPMEIYSLSFYNTYLDSGSYDPNIGTYSLYLSTTNALVDALSTDPNANKGGDNTLVYHAELTSFGDSFGGRMDLVFDESFFYDPALGNLLLTVISSDASTLNYLWMDMDPSNSDGMSRLYGVDIDSWALVTGFNEAHVPEPSSLVLLFIGMLATTLSRKKWNLRDKQPKRANCEALKR